jgi:beta-catenin-like protein 1
MENLFDALCSALAELEAKGAFDAAEGVELMVLMMKAHNTASTRAIKVLDYACQTDSDEGKRCCEKFVEVAGLKALFAVLMGKVCTIRPTSLQHLTYRIAGTQKV